MLLPGFYLCSDDGEQDEERNELRENCFAAFESVVLRCPREVPPTAPLTSQTNWPYPNLSLRRQTSPSIEPQFPFEYCV
jgi:hypothetical protein